MLKHIKFILFSVVILVFALLLIDLICLVLLDLKSTPAVNNVLHPNIKNHCYEDYDWAEKHFSELNHLKAEYKAFIGWRRNEYQGQTISIDSLGIRKTKEFSSEVNNEKMTLFLGGSTIWGTGVDDNHTIPSIYQELSEQRCLNFGESGYTSWQSYTFLKLKSLKNPFPSTVITYDGVNNSPAHTSRMFSHSRESQIVARLRGQDNSNKNLTISDHLLKPTRLILNKVKEKFKSKDQELSPPYNSPQRNLEAATELLDSWVEIKELCKQNGAEFYCVLQPNAFYGKPNISYLELSSHRYKDGYGYYSKVIELINNDEKYIHLKKCFINLANSLDSVPNVYIDFCHLSPKGNSLIASSIHDSILKLNKPLTYTE